MKILFLAMTTVICFITFAGTHRGGNGGDGMELKMKKRALQIGQFLNSTVGKDTFDLFNPDSIIETTEKLDFNIISDFVYDKHGIERTCVNESETLIITCNNQKLTDQEDDVLTALVFHEILGLKGLEYGYLENVSEYPISSKIIPYHQIVVTTKISESDIRPEYFGLDKRSYGVTYINRKTNESIRMVCLNDNVEVNRCRRFSVVKSAQGLQSPFISNKVTITPYELNKIKLNDVTDNDLDEIMGKLTELKENGFNFLSFGAFKEETCDKYAFGIGLNQMIYNAPYFEELEECNIALNIGASFVPFIGWPLLLSGLIVDLPIELFKQSINSVIYPIKLVINSFKIIRIKFKKEKIIKKTNKNIQRVRELLNLSNDLSLVNKTKKISDKRYKSLELLTKSILD